MIKNFNQKSRKPIMFTANSSKTHKVTVNQLRIQFVITFNSTLIMTIIFIPHKY